MFGCAIGPFAYTRRPTKMNWTMDLPYLFQFISIKVSFSHVVCTSGRERDRMTGWVSEHWQVRIKEGGRGNKPKFVWILRCSCFDTFHSMAPWLHVSMHNANACYFREPKTARDIPATTKTNKHFSLACTTKFSVGFIFHFRKLKTQHIFRRDFFFPICDGDNMRTNWQTNLHFGCV